MPQGEPLTVPDDGLTTKQRRNRPLLAVHTGTMKGKSTAAFGMAMRAWNQGWSIAVYQFVKSAKWKVGEENALTALGRLHEQTGEGGPVVWHKMGSGWSWSRRQGTEVDHAADAAEGWAQIRRDLAAETHRFYVLDEFTYPIMLGFKWNPTYIGMNAAPLAARQIMDGVIEAGGGGIATYTNYNTLAEVYQLPFLINSYETEWAALQTPEWQAIIDAVEESIGSVYICGTVDVGMRHVASVDKPVTCLADMQGLKIRTASSTVLIEALEDLGASPIVVGYTEVYSALSNGVVNAEDVNYMTAVAQSHFEVCKYFTEVGMYPYPTFMCFNKDFIDSLPEGYWDFMQECMNEAMETFFTETIVGADANYRKVLEDNGVTIYELSDLDAWRAAIQPLYDEYTAEGTDQRIIDFINAVEAIKANQ